MYGSNSLQATTHMELDEKAMLSAIAQLTPYSDFNQSPRNMYQCQVYKFIMDTSLFTHTRIPTVRDLCCKSSSQLKPT